MCYRRGPPRQPRSPSCRGSWTTSSRSWQRKWPKLRSWGGEEEKGGRREGAGDFKGVASRCCGSRKARNSKMGGIELKEANQESSRSSIAAIYEKQRANKAVANLEEMASHRDAELRAARDEVKSDLANSIELRKLTIQRTFPYFHRDMNHVLCCTTLEGIPFKTLVSWTMIDSFDSHLHTVHNIIPYFKEELVEAMSWTSGFKSICGPHPPIFLANIPNIVLFELAQDMEPNF